MNNAMVIPSCISVISLGVFLRYTSNPSGLICHGEKGWRGSNHDVILQVKTKTAQGVDFNSRSCSFVGVDD